AIGGHRKMETADARQCKESGIQLSLLRHLLQARNYVAANLGELYTPLGCSKLGLPSCAAGCHHCPSWKLLNGEIWGETTPGLLVPRRLVGVAVSVNYHITHIRAPAHG